MLKAPVQSYLDGEDVSDERLEEERVVFPDLRVVADAALGLPLLGAVPDRHLVDVARDEPREPGQTCAERDCVATSSQAAIRPNMNNKGSDSVA